MLPESVRAQVEARLGPVREVRPVGGGCINPAYRLTLSGEPVFLKYSESIADLFAAEAEGLAALREAASGLRIPAVLALQDSSGESPAWIALEWLEPARRAERFGERLGHGLAALHRTRARGWGWERDGYIGSLPQDNSPSADWSTFWIEQRLEPQLARARDAGGMPGGESQWQRLFSAIPGVLRAGEEDGPSLLHGDLWGGNVLAVEDGAPALIDPATYRGHREVDLAMTELFGGFDSAFYAAYREAWPLRPGYSEVRRGVYQLYFLLVHVNLFGAGYVSRTAAVLRGILSAL